MAPERRAAAVFLDRDGVLNELVDDPGSGTCESPYSPEDVALVPGAAKAVRTLREAGLRPVVVSNQPAAAKGTATRKTLDAVHARVAELLAAAGAEPDAWLYCFHHPDFGGRCACRKPEPGLLVRAARELVLDLAASWMVGDSDSDVEAGRRAGCRTILVENPRSTHRRRGGGADAIVRDLREAAAVISAATRVP